MPSFLFRPVGPWLNRSLLTLSWTLSLSLLSHPGWGQASPLGPSSSPFRLLPNYEPVYAYAERLPVYKDGGNQRLLAFIKQSHITRPAGVKQLFLSFTVDKQGKPTQPTLSAVPSNRSVPPSTYEEVTRLLNRMKDFVPAQQQGNPVNLSLTVPLLPLEGHSKEVR